MGGRGSGLSNRRKIGTAKTGQVIYSTKHVFDQATLRGISVESIGDAVSHPLHITPAKSDGNGRLSRQYIGKSATVAVNPLTGEAVSVWQTSQRMIRKYKGGRTDEVPADR